MSNPSLCLLTDFMITGGLEAVVCQALDFLVEKYDVTVIALDGGVSGRIKERFPNSVTVIEGKRTRAEKILMYFPIVGSILISRIVKKKFDYLIVLRGGAPYGSTQCNFIQKHLLVPQ